MPERPTTGNGEHNKSVTWVCLTCGWHTTLEMPGFGGSTIHREHRHFQGEVGCGPLVGVIPSWEAKDCEWCKGSGVTFWFGGSPTADLRLCGNCSTGATLANTRIPAVTTSEPEPRHLKAVDDA